MQVRLGFAETSPTFLEGQLSVAEVELQKALGQL